jgi:hypothetical protein
MQHRHHGTAKCSTGCGSCWSRYNARPIYILQMQMLLEQLLEMVLVAKCFSNKWVEWMMGVIQGGDICEW